MVNMLGVTHHTCHNRRVRVTYTYVTYKLRSLEAGSDLCLVLWLVSPNEVSLYNYLSTHRACDRVAVVLAVNKRLETPCDRHRAHASARAVEMSMSIGVYRT